MRTSIFVLAIFVAGCAVEVHIPEIITVEQTQSDASPDTCDGGTFCPPVTVDPVSGLPVGKDCGK
jgi:hypothetical protein